MKAKVRHLKIVVSTDVYCMILDENMQDEDAEMMDHDATPVPTTPSAIHLPPFVPSLLALIQPTTLSFPPLSGGVSPHPPTTSALAAVHIAALECLNNIFLALATSLQSQQAGPSTADAAVGAGIWSQIWACLEAIGTDVNGPGQERRREVWEIAVGVLWGVAGVWKGVLVSSQSLEYYLIGTNTFS